MLGFNVCGHAFHRLFITSLVNEPGVSVEESLAASHHNSVAAQHAYMTRGSTSEMAKFNALGLHGKQIAFDGVFGNWELGFQVWSLGFGICGLRLGNWVWVCFELWDKLTIK